MGDTGSGKTVTLFRLLKELGWRRIPFLVFEGAKDEYRNLWSSCNILHFTPGIETINPFRLNFLVVPRGVHIQTHIEGIVSAFQHAFDMPPILAMILEETVARVYKELGWNITHNRPPLGKDIFPRPVTLLKTFKKVLQQRESGMGYAGEIATNIPSALTSRLMDLLRWGRGAMFNSKASIPIQDLYQKNVVFELKGMGNDYRRRLFVGLFLVIYFEFLSARGVQDRLKHVMVFEEAHRILGTPLSTNTSGSTIGHKTIAIIQDLIAEARALGEGLIIADQYPLAIPRRISAMANSTIIHQLKSSISCHYLCEQFKTLHEIPRLNVGTVLYVAPNAYSKTVMVPNLTFRKVRISDEDIKIHMAPFYEINPWIFEADGIESFLLGLSSDEIDPALDFSASAIDQACAKIVYTQLTHCSSPANPFSLQHRMYAPDQCHKQLTLDKLHWLSTQPHFKALLTQLDLLTPTKSAGHTTLAHLYLPLLRVATSHLPTNPTPLPGVIYFLTILVFKYLSSPINKRIPLFRYLIKLVAQHGFPFFHSDPP